MTAQGEWRRGGTKECQCCLIKCRDIIYLSIYFDKCTFILMINNWSLIQWYQCLIKLNPCRFDLSIYQFINLSIYRYIDICVIILIFNHCYIDLWYNDTNVASSSTAVEISSINRYIDICIIILIVNIWYIELWYNATNVWSSSTDVEIYFYIEILHTTYGDIL